MAVYLEGQACDLRDPSPLPEDPVVAMSYIPFQQFNTVYQPEMGFDAGTIFPELNKPFTGKRGESR